MNNDATVGVLLCYLIFAIPISMFIAFELERRLKTRLPHTKPYRWGYYNGCMALACAPLSVILLFLDLSVAKDGADVLAACFMAAYLLVVAACGLFIIKRNRWAWVVATILSLNIVCWIINGIYLKRRWAELEAEEMSVPPAAPPEIPSEPTLPPA